MPTRTRRRGFTLVELLVVIAIVGILVALLLPAVQAAREASRRTACLNNLRQVGLGVQNHHDVVGHYPTGRESLGMKGVSWAFRLLPYLEEQPLFDAHDPNQRVDADANATAMRTPVSLYYCPSRRAPTADRDFPNNGAEPEVRASAAAGDYAANTGPRLLYGADETGRPLAPIDGAIAGPIFTFSEVQARQVTDGLSATIVVGEKWIPEEQNFNNDGDGSDLCDPGDEHFCQGDTAFFAGNLAESIFGEELSSGTHDDSDSEFGSEHPGVAHFVFLDGHTEAISIDMDDDVFLLLGVIADGEVILQR